MAIREIRVVPDPVLRTPCDPIKEITPAVRHLVQDLLDTVDDPGRAGLSANQIGVNLRAFSYNINGKIGYVLNPVLEETSGEQYGDEMPVCAGIVVQDPSRRLRSCAWHRFGRQDGRAGRSWHYGPHVAA